MPAGVAYPEWSVIEFNFLATKQCPQGVKLFWHEANKWLGFKARDGYDMTI